MNIKHLLNTLAVILTAALLSPVYAEPVQLQKEYQKNRQQQHNNKHAKKQADQTRQRHQHSIKTERKTDKQHTIRHQHRDKKTDVRRHAQHPVKSYAKYPKQLNTRRQIRHDRYRNFYRHYRNDQNDHRRYEYRRGHKLLWLTPRHRIYHNIRIIRPFGHTYYGYGYYLSDRNAWRWLSLTAISLKLLDLVNEQAQREYEDAQIRATEADVGERIYWDTDDAYGYVVTTREGRNQSGLPCREFQQSITVGGKSEEAYGTACLQPDGAWKIVD